MPSFQRHLKSIKPCTEPKKFFSNIQRDSAVLRTYLCLRNINTTKLVDERKHYRLEILEPSVIEEVMEEKKSWKTSHAKQGVLVVCRVIHVINYWLEY
jgi:hypothetical protein